MLIPLIAIRTFLFFALIIVGAFVLIYKLMFSKDSTLDLDNFKRNSDKIVIDLTKASVKTNNWTEETVIRENHYDGLNQLAGHPERNTKKEDKHLSLLTIYYNYKGKENKYETTLPMDQDNLNIYLNLRRETTLFIDPIDPEIIYLDLEFLNKPTSNRIYNNK